MQVFCEDSSCVLHVGSHDLNDASRIMDDGEIHRVREPASEYRSGSHPGNPVAYCKICGSHLYEREAPVMVQAPPGEVNPAALQTILGRSLGLMVSLTPSAPDCKGLILRQIGLWIPDDVPPEGIGAYVMSHLSERQAALVRNIATVAVASPVTVTANAATVPPVQVNPLPVAAATPVQQAEFQVAYENVEDGTANFRQLNRHAGTVAVNYNRLHDLVLESSNEDELTEAIEELLRNEVSDEDLPEVHIGDTDYEDHEVNESHVRDLVVSNIDQVIADLSIRFAGEGPFEDAEAEPEPEEEEIEPEPEPEESEDEDDEEAEEDEEEEDGGERPSW